MQQADIVKTFIYQDGDLHWRNSGRLACRLFKNGYKYIEWRCKRHLQSNLIWIYHHGDIPEGFTIDHKDVCSRNDNVSNLRLATQSQQNHNRPVRVDSKSGIKGVRFRRDGRSKPWEARLGKKTIGYYSTEEEAKEYWNLATRERFGDFYHV